jgi:hypothetical protein
LFFLAGLLLLDSSDDERENFDKKNKSILDTISSFNDSKQHQNGLNSSHNLSSSALKELPINTINFNKQQQNVGILQNNNNSISLQQQHLIYLNTAKLLISLIHAWDNDETVDDIAINSLKLFKPKIPICFGIIFKGLHFLFFARKIYKPFQVMYLFTHHTLLVKFLH